MAVESMLMKDGQSRLGAISGSSAQCIAIAATFTAEPVQEAFEFWMEEIGQPGSIEFAPYNQVFQQLLDPNSLLGKNRRGVNVVLVRLEDWQRFYKGVNGHGNPGSVLAQSAADLIRRCTVCNGAISGAVSCCLLSEFPDRAGRFRGSNGIRRG